MTFLKEFGIIRAAICVLLVIAAIILLVAVVFTSTKMVSVLIAGAGGFVCILVSYGLFQSRANKLTKE